MKPIHWQLIVELKEKEVASTLLCYLADQSLYNYEVERDSDKTTVTISSIWIENIFEISLWMNENIKEDES
jgi:hypothetical protein